MKRRTEAHEGGGRRKGTAEMNSCDRKIHFGPEPGEQSAQERMKRRYLALQKSGAAEPRVSASLPPVSCPQCRPTPERWW